MIPEIGDTYRKRTGEGVYARVTGLDEPHVLFEIWDMAHPGWQGGAALTKKSFDDIYYGPVTGWDNSSADPEYHEFGHNCNICK